VCSSDLPTSNPETRTTGKRGETRLLTEVEQNRFAEIMGRKYREYILRETPTLTALPREDALKKLQDDTNDIKAQAEEEAVLSDNPVGLTPFRIL
jgi:hypothetical protein